MNIKPALIFEAIFAGIAFLIYSVTGNEFFIFNFLYIGTALAVGIFLVLNNYRYGRNLIMLAIGSYLLIYVGIIGHENISMAGFWYYLFLGVFEAAVIHFLIAKIIGPVIFGRGWCGYACWTAMILDLLPYKIPENRRKNFGYIRYILFVFIFTLMLALFLFKVNNLENIMFYLFVLGNIAYYVVGIFLAFYLKDNRAFCKYVCPITVFLKIGSYFSLLRISVDENLCNECVNCVRMCPMDVDILDDSRKRENGTECILCMNCVKECSNDAVKL